MVSWGRTFGGWCAYFVNLITGERCVGCHEEVATRGGYQGGDYSDEVVVHVSWVSKSLRARRHHSRDLATRYQIQNQGRSKYTYKLIGLVETGCLYMQPVRRNTSQRAVIQNDDRVCMIY